MQGPTVVRRQLGRRLRRLREAAGKTERDLQEANLLSRAKLWRIESGKTPVKVSDVRALCWLYDVDETTTEALATLAAGTDGQGWWEDYGDVLPGWFNLYLGLEAAATEIWLYDPELIHGLLQTPAYLRSLYEESGVEIDEVTVQRQIKLRHERQQILTNRTPPLTLTAILGAGVLTRLIGGPKVMADQIAQLRELSQLENVDVQVLPWEAGAHAAMHTGAFAILDFADSNDPSVAYVETHTGARYLEKPEELDGYRKIFDLVYKKTVPIERYSS